MSTHSSQPASEILGYKLENRIGSGGFGEVWAVEAPGGLKKALKIVYGFHDEKRAQTELKSLDRVKSLRHPFLLSLERIEVAEGQLVVISELADASLADLFNDYTAKGEPGIPRDEMLRYMSNAAEALDYLSVEKSLQHLDVKPENLLMVSGHVKVADFGLMKDLQVASQSMMQGMTPAYAAPEMFDGKPTASSDQYSLAIMYCEMVSGVRPFPGTTPAQLAAQHIHGKPNLRPVPKGDQAAVARALSKDPSVRYPSCLAFVEDLKKQRRTVRKALRRTETRRIQESDSETFLFNGKEVNCDNTEMVSERKLPFKASSIEVVSPPACSPEESLIRPTLIVTVGQTANRVGQKIKEKLYGRAGHGEAVPSIRSVFIDSDRNSLSQLGGELQTTVSPLETIEVPLKKPEDYRANADVHLGWLSRRWIYNVPRTLQTEGLRPLGRLAFADHFAEICESLEKTISQFALAENLAKTADALKMNPGDPNSPQVYLISSISGGIGSGMLLDLAYTIKLLMAEKGLPYDSVNAILMHSAYQRSRDPGLAAANAFAFLTEFRHFNELGYPGDATLGIPEFEDEPPFAQTYFTELGDDLNQSEFDSQLESVAEYVSLATTSKCASFFDTCRKSEFDREHFALRTLGLSVTGAGDPDYRRNNVNRLCHEVYRRWMGLCDVDETGMKSKADEILRSASVCKDNIEDRVAQQTTALGQEAELKQKLEEALQFPPQQVTHAVVECLDNQYGKMDLKQEQYDDSTLLCNALDEYVAGDEVVGNSLLAHACVAELQLETFSLGHVDGIVSELTNTLNQWLDLSEQERQQAASEQRHVLNSIHQTCSQGQTVSREEVFRYAQLRKQEFIKHRTTQYIKVLLNGLVPVRTVLSQIEANLEIFKTKIDYNEIPFDTEIIENTFDPQRALIEQINREMSDMIEKTERMVFHSLINPEGGYQSAFSNENVLRYGLPNELCIAATKVLCNVKESLSFEKVIRENTLAPEQLTKWLSDQINRAKPSIDDCGGQMRVLVGLPTSSEPCQLPDLIENGFQLKTKSIHGTDGKLVICFEAEDVSLAAVAFRLLSKRPDAVELVKRIHSRDDVDWTSLDDLL